MPAESERVPAYSRGGLSRIAGGSEPRSPSRAPSPAPQIPGGASPLGRTVWRSSEYLPCKVERIHDAHPQDRSMAARGRQETVVAGGQGVGAEQLGAGQVQCVKTLEA